MNTQHDFTKSAKAQLDKWDTQIAKAEARLQDAEEDARQEIRKQLDEMRSARDEAKEQLEGLQSSGKAALGDVSEGLEEAWARLEKSFDRAAARFA
jgi:chromosome segregation ATPase